MNQSGPRVSVILPFFNAAGTLDRAIRSIAEQDFDDLECILVDNNSSDLGPDIAVAWTKRDRRFRLVRESRQGVMFASNRGCEQAEGAYLARMDADDFAYPSRLKLQVDFLDNHPGYGSVAGLANHVGDPETTRGFARFVDWSNSLVSYQEIFLKRFIEAPVVNPTAMWRRETMEQHGLYRHGDFPEDYEMWLRWLDEGVKIAKVPSVILDWHDSNDRLTRSHPIYRDSAFYRVKTRYLAKWLTRVNPHHPRVWIWGASRISRRRAILLEDAGIQIETYIDTRKGRQLDRNLLYYKDLPKAGSCFVLTYIRQMENRLRIQRFLEERGYREGIDFLIVS
jgi:glycosyltransferase involved in cell wall biosynthesis